jgi:hypothetical protein
VTTWQFLSVTTSSSSIACSRPSIRCRQVSLGRKHHALLDLEPPIERHQAPTDACVGLSREALRAFCCWSLMLCVEFALLIACAPTAFASIKSYLRYRKRLHYQLTRYRRLRQKAILQTFARFTKYPSRHRNIQRCRSFRQWMRALPPQGVDYTLAEP